MRVGFRGRVLAGAAALLLAAAPIAGARAEDAGIPGAGGPGAGSSVWPMSTEYPAGNISGVGLTTFARLVAERSGGALAVRPTHNSRITTADLPRAAAAGEVAGGDAFAGQLDALDPVFALASLPFLAPTLDEAHALNRRARPAYEAALARQGLRLLYLTLWPRTGLWSDRPLAGADALRGLRVRAYDASAAAVLTAAGADATFMPFGEAMARLKRQELDGVLTSGDGGSVRGLWTALTHFAAIGYAVPASLAVVRAELFDALPEPVRAQVLAAARETEAAQLALAEQRERENYAQMRAHGVVIADPPAAGLVARLRAGAAPVIQAWRARVPPETAGLSEVGAAR